MPEGYLHLTCEQRCQIYALLQSGHSQAHIARQIGVDPSTISRELVRNTGARGYRFKQAHEKASQRRQEASDKPRKMTPDLVELIEEKLTQEQWSPDQISGRLAKDGVAFISHERIYQHVWKDKKDGGTLYLHLRHSGKKYNRRKGKNSGRGLIPNRVDIDQRPPIVAAKSRIGDWEADTIIGANHKGVVMSHVERTSKYTKLAKLPDKNADFVVQACARVLLPLADQIETITYDNGKEFASHAQIATSLGALSLEEAREALSGEPRNRPNRAALGPGARPQLPKRLQGPPDAARAALSRVAGRRSSEPQRSAGPGGRLGWVWRWINLSASAERSP